MVIKLIVGLQAVVWMKPGVDRKLRHARDAGKWFCDQGRKRWNKAGHVGLATGYKDNFLLQRNIAKGFLNVPQFVGCAGTQLNIGNWKYAFHDRLELYLLIEIVKVTVCSQCWPCRIAVQHLL